MTEDPLGLSLHQPGLQIPRPLLAGWKEFVDFPDWKIRHVRAKVDTGARTSALGALRYDVMNAGGRGLWMRMWLALYPKHPDRIAVIEVPVLHMVVVANSSGFREERPLIETQIHLGPIRKLIRLTVTNRSAMRFRMILGRQALTDDFVVDVSKKYLLRQRTKG
jgi:hypothetical protein